MPNNAKRIAEGAIKDQNIPSTAKIALRTREMKVYISEQARHGKYLTHFACNKSAKTHCLSAVIIDSGDFDKFAARIFVKFLKT